MTGAAARTCSRSPSRLLRRDPAEDERLGEPARVAAGRDTAHVDPGSEETLDALDPGTLVDADAALGMGDRGGDVEAQLGAVRLDGPARLAQGDHARVVAMVGRDDEPRRAARLTGNRLREVAFVPRRRAGEELLALLVQEAGLAVPELGEPYVVLLLDLGRRRRHRPAVELLEVAGDLCPSRMREVEALALAPRVRAHKELVFACVPDWEAAGGEHERRLRFRRQPLFQPHLARGAHEGAGQATRVETLIRRQGIGRLLTDDLRPQPDQPYERLVEAVEHGSLKAFVPAGAFSAEILEREVTPDHAAGEQHRATRPVALFDEQRMDPE